MPAMSFTKLMTSFAWNSQTVASVPGLATKIAIVGKAVLAKCDALDGVVDGAIGDPPACSFDPATLLCKSGTATGCLSAAEVEALHRLHDGPRLRDGTRLFPGLATGVESHPTELNAWLMGEKALQPAMSEEAFRWMAHRDPKWTRSQFDLDRDAVVAGRALSEKEKIVIPLDEAAEMAPIAPELGEFRAHYAGFFDPGFGVTHSKGKAVLEVRSRDVPFILEDGQPVGRLVFEKLTQKPDVPYGAAGSYSTYAGQGLRLSKYFEAAED